MTEKEKISIKGQHFEIEPKFRKITEFKIGDPVKVLTKGSYSTTYQTAPGIIAGFDPFEKLPTINIAYLDLSYSAASIKWLAFNENTVDVEICPVFGDHELTIDRDHVLNLMNSEIHKKELEVMELRTKREHFLRKFATYFKDTEPTPEERARLAQEWQREHN